MTKQWDILYYRGCSGHVEGTALVAVLQLGSHTWLAAGADRTVHEVNLRKSRLSTREPIAKVVYAPPPELSTEFREWAVAEATKLKDIKDVQLADLMAEWKCCKESAARMAEHEAQKKSREARGNAAGGRSTTTLISYSTL